MSIKHRASMKTLEDLYGFTRTFIVELEETGHPELAREVDRAMKGGATSGEILAYLGVAFSKAKSLGLGDNRLDAALRFIITVT